MPLNSDWNCTMALLTRARSASFSFLQLPPNPAPASLASVRALHENVRINTPALCRLHRCAPRPPPASSSKHPFLILTYSTSSLHVPTVNSHESPPLPPLPCENSCRCSTSNSSISCHHMPNSTGHRRSLPRMSLQTTGGVPVSSSVPHPATPQAFTLLQGLAT